MFKPTANIVQKRVNMATWPIHRAGLAERRSFRKLEQRFAVLADNEQWLADNYQHTVRTEQERSVGAPLADEKSSSCGASASH